MHHSERRLYWMNGTRFHPLDEVPLVALQGASLFALGVDDEAMVVHNVFKVIHGLLQHANVAGRCGPLNHLFSTAEQHRFHHAVGRGDRAVNYGAVLSVWDRVFGTQRLPDGSRFAQPIGLAMARFPTSFTGQMRVPFRWVEGTGPVGDPPGQLAARLGSDAAATGSGGGSVASRRGAAVGRASGRRSTFFRLVRTICSR